ncbi:MAG: hypothetical protein ACRDKW_11880 [Actinomycetota bacterium]
MRRPTVAARGMALLLALGLTVACGSDGDTDGGPSPTAGPGGRPLEWGGARGEGDRLEVVRSTGSAPRQVATQTVTARPSDFAYDDGTAHVGFCCEGGVGRLLSADVRVAQPKLAARGEAMRIDLAAGWSVLVDAAGGYTVGPSDDRDAYQQTGVGATDAALRGNDARRLATLIDPARVRKIAGAVAPGAQRVRVEERDDAGAWKQLAEVPLPTDRQYCGVVWVGTDRIGLVKGELDPGDPLFCVGRVMDFYTVGVNRLDVDGVVFDAPVVHLNVDSSSTFLIFVTVTGSVEWMTLDGRAGELAEGGYVAADW